VELHPQPLEAHLDRIREELATRSSIYDLPSRRFFKPDPTLDCSVGFRAARAATPAGPAAGPQSQLIQNIVLSWLAGSRVIELKTVQVDDRLVIPRPCIDARTVGFNVEWSQELRVEQALEEYVASWMLIRILRAQGVIPFGPGQETTLFDMSVGYDLAGIRTKKVSSFVRGMVDATPTIERLRARLARSDHARWADLDYDPNVAAGITLSTFHGCPASEIEGICDYLLRELGVHVVIKMNPTLLGFDAVSAIVKDELGYAETELDRGAFDKDLKWDEAQGIVQRLEAIAKPRGLTVGVKFSNTLIVKNKDTFFTDPTMYMSGPPLHVLAIALASRFRERFGDRFGISFSAGVDARNFPDLVACDLAPITSCTDLLKAGGYARMTAYLEGLEQGMKAKGVANRGDYVLAARGNGARAAAELLPGDADAIAEHLASKGPKDVRGLLAKRGQASRYEALVARAGALNLVAVAAEARIEPRYRKDKNAKAPRKIGSKLWLFDCVNCDKCVQVCPNDANFFIDVTPFVTESAEEVVVTGPGATATKAGKPYKFEKEHQLANFADFCNDCGNCDVFCPEDGGPYVVKPRFFGSRDAYLEARKLDGFHLERLAQGGVRMAGRLEGKEHALVRSPGEPDRFEDDGVAVELDPATGAVLSARPFFRAAPGHALPLWRYFAMRALLEGVLAKGATTPVGALLGADRVL
jgi:putative selenate reductase